MDFVLVKERLAERPESLDDRDIAILDYFGGSQEVQAAFAARDAARRPAAPLRPAAAAPLHSVGAFVDRIKEMNALNRERNRRIDALEQRIAALEARPALHDAGAWRPDTTYNAGALVSFDGSGWICNTTHRSAGREPSHDCFRLLTKRGRDGRGLR